MSMGKLTKILLLIVFFLAGCVGHTDGLVKRESKVDALLNQEQNKQEYTIKRASNGVYIYTDKPQPEDLNNLYKSKNGILYN